ncbi:MAG: hypothetical protein ACJ8GN_30090 [Longimicrobiaceae bacterium]
MNGSNMASGSNGATTLSRLAQWAYTPRRPLVFILVESLAALAAEGLVAAAEVRAYPAILVRIASAAAGALLANRIFRRPEEERVQEDLAQDLSILKQLGLTPARVQQEMVRLFRTYLAAVRRLRKARADLAPGRRSVAPVEASETIGQGQGAPARSSRTRRTIRNSSVRGGMSRPRRHKSVQ